MGAIDRLSTSLPEDIDEDSNDKSTHDQTVKALSDSFQKSVMSKVESCRELKDAVCKMSIKNINNLLFDESVPGINEKNYYLIIEEFLSAPDSYKDELQAIVEGYLQVITEMQQRVQSLLLNGKTNEYDEENKTSTASYLDTRLTAICERTKLVLYVNKVNRNVDDLQKQLNGDFNSTIRDLETTLQGLNHAIYGETVGTDEKKSQGIKNAIDSLSKKVNDIDNTSDKIMPNIITLLGVFSSVIVVILTLITTSSTWLSNANEASVLIAFVIPSAIATLTVCALTAFIRPLIDSVPETTMGQSQGKVAWWLDMCTTAKRTIQRWGLWFSVAVIALLVVFGTMWFCKMEENNKTHYIVKCLPMSETVDPSNGVTVQPTSGTSSPELFIIYDVTLPTREIYHEKILCSECDKHEDGYVYYCLLHKRFE